MKVIDAVYGDTKIKEQVLIDLINCPSMQRLKKISQFGMPDEYYHIKGFSRYEHCVGVMVLLRRLEASLKEQIAGLLHDVSHTAFSHVIDWVVGDPNKEDHQDNSLLDFVEKSEIPGILEKYNFDYKEICEHENFSLLENNAPDICADRVDYSLREIISFETSENINLILNSLINPKGKIIFNNKNAAEIFAKSYVKCQKEHWAGTQAKARYHILSSILKKALDEKIIFLQDLWKTDQEVIDILKESKINDILDNLNLLKKGFDVVESQNKNSFILKKKFRWVDPQVLFEERLARVSDFSEEYKSILENEKSDSKITKTFEVISK